MHNSACTAFARDMSYTSNCVEQNLLLTNNLTYNSAVGWGERNWPVYVSWCQLWIRTPFLTCNSKQSPSIHPQYPTSNLQSFKTP